MLASHLCHAAQLWYDDKNQDKELDSKASSLAAFRPGYVFQFLETRSQVEMAAARAWQLHWQQQTECCVLQSPSLLWSGLISLRLAVAVWRCASEA